MKSLPFVIATFLLLCVSLRAEDTSRLAALFTKMQSSGIVTIPPGDYWLDGTKPIPLHSDLNVLAYGARIHFPKQLGDKARAVMFSGEDIHDLRWSGGHFTGHVFDPSKKENNWEPNVNTRGILVTTTPDGDTSNLTFRDVSSDGMAGAVITVLGAEKKGNEREVLRHARNITVENCTLERSGKFMWDYGYLWQITVWPEDYNEAELAMAAKYFRNDLVHGTVRMDAGDDRVFFSNSKPLPISVKREGADADRGHDAVITGNTVDGSNGSRVISVEKSCEDVSIVGNTFRNGGRGSWINQPRNFVLADNIFQNNTTKCERDPSRGRRSFITGDYETYDELYFTTHEKESRYGNVTVRGNLFTSGPNATHAITFAPRGDTILISDNIFSGPIRDIAPAIGCDNVNIRYNLGLSNQP